MQSDQINNITLDPNALKTSYPKGRLTVILIVLLILSVVAAVSFLNGGWMYAVGMIAFVIYVPLITFAQKKSDYRFEFRDEKGLRDFKLYYKDKELKLDYRLDRTGRFMWDDNRKSINNISYADGSRMNTVYTKYRILNFVNSFMEQNGLNAADSY